MTTSVPKVDLQTTDATVDAEVERICALGCRGVYSMIDHIEDRGVPDDLSHLGRTQRAQLLEELKAIMAVYAENGESCLLS